MEYRDIVTVTWHGVSWQWHDMEYHDIVTVKGAVCTNCVCVLQHCTGHRMQWLHNHRILSITRRSDMWYWPGVKKWCHIGMFWLSQAEMSLATTSSGSPSNNVTCYSVSARLSRLCTVSTVSVSLIAFQWRLIRFHPYSLSVPKSRINAFRFSYVFCEYAFCLEPITTTYSWIIIPVHFYI